jgi:large conductance mechanosensitive channel
MLSEFRAFLLKQNIVALAIGVVVGAALNRVVQAFVDDFVMPVVAVLTPSGNWREAVWQVGRVRFLVGDFLSAILSFLVVGFVAWRIAKLLLEDAKEPPTKVCTFCRSKIDPAATRCPNCTSQLAAA